MDVRALMEMFTEGLSQQNRGDRIQFWRSIASRLPDAQLSEGITWLLDERNSRSHNQRR